MGSEHLTGRNYTGYRAAMSDTIREVGTPATTSEVSQRIAAEIRAEAGRQGVSIREVARLLGVSQPWLARRVSIHADVDLKVSEIDLIAGALGTSAERLIAASGWLRVGIQPPLDAAA